jgi:hypothetical protein
VASPGQGSGSYMVALLPCPLQTQGGGGQVPLWQDSCKNLVASLSDTSMSDFAVFWLG